MPVIRTEKTDNFTIMANHHLRDMSLSLKARGLLSLMLSLPDDWDYSARGLACLCRDGVSSINSALKELEQAGYVARSLRRNSRGKIVDTEYTVYEVPLPMDSPQTDLPQTDLPQTDLPQTDLPQTDLPQTDLPQTDSPQTDLPQTDSPQTDSPQTENRTQLNKDKQKKDKPKKEKQRKDQPIPPNPPRGPDGTGERTAFRDRILENIDYGILIQNSRLDRTCLDELVELMVDTACSGRKRIRIAGADHPVETVRERFLTLDSSHIEYVLERLNETAAPVRNIRQYLLAALYNAPATIDSYYAAQVRHDQLFPPEPVDNSPLPVWEPPAQPCNPPPVPPEGNPLPSPETSPEGPWFACSANDSS